MHDDRVTKRQMGEARSLVSLRIAIVRTRIMQYQLEF